MSTYGLKYQTQFDSVSDVNNPSRTYTLQFLFKDYNGQATSIDGGGTTVLQKCTIDDPFAPIRGQSLDIRLLNKGNIPIRSFQSEDDDGVQVMLLDENSTLLFIGFLVQDDFYETKVDFAHEITLSATDSLGLLKGVILSEQVLRRAFQISFRTNVANDIIYFYTQDTSFQPAAGNSIEVQNNTYTIVTAVNETTLIGIAYYNWTVTVTPATGGIAQTVEVIYLSGTVNLLNRNTLLTMIALCLSATNIPLELNIFHNLYEISQDSTKSTFDQTLIDSQLFISGETYENCYEVLTKIMATFRCSIFQANGKWNIVHWDEAYKYANNNIPGFRFSAEFLYLGAAIFNNNFFIGPETGAVNQLTRPIAGLQESNMRGWKFSRKTFNYVYPKYLLKNYDLLELGELRSDYVSGGIRYKEYVAVDWLGASTPQYVDRFIRVASDAITGTEINRTLVVRGDSGSAFPNAKSVIAAPIEVFKGDKVKVSFSFRGQNSFSGTWSIVFAMMLYDGVNTRYIDELPAGNGDWVSTLGFLYNGSGTNTSDWHDVEIQSSQIPYSGLFYVCLNELYQNGDITEYKNIRFEYTSYINDSTKIIGQIHKSEQTPNKKLNNDVEITIDDSPRNAIAGTLFLKTVTSLIQDKTVFWQYSGDLVSKRLGQHTTIDELVWKRKTRLKLEGGFIGIMQDSLISLLSMQVTDYDPLKNYTFGLLTIDYKNNQFSGTLWEVYDKADADLVYDYNFKYIYSTT